MIDWTALFFNSLWILGASILLAAFSYHYWLAHQQQRPVGEQLSHPSVQQLFWVSLILVGIGLVGTSDNTWETVVWLLFILYSILSWVKLRRDSRIS